MRRLQRFTCALALLLVGFGAQAGCFLFLDGIPGESTDTAHANHCDTDRFSWAVSASSSSAGGGAGDVNFVDLAVIKRIDKASPELALRCASGTKIASVVLACRKPGATFDYLKITLTGAFITSVSTSGSDVASESISFKYDRIDWEYVPPKADGSAGTPVRRWYDVLKGVGGS